MAKKIKRVKYFTKDKLALINPENKKLYEKYLKSNIIKNKDVKNTTYKVYENYFNHFLVYLAEEWDNIGLYDDEFFENAVDIMEGFMSFCQDVLHNNKKVINTKIAAVSSFYLWSLRRGLIEKHPFDKKLERMKDADKEQIISSHYLNDEQIAAITEGLKDESKYDIQDRLIWHIMIDSGNRVGAISKLTLSSLDLENMMFVGIREKRGYLVEVAFEPDTKKLIEEWLKIRKEKLDGLTVDAFFITKRNGEYRPMHKSTIQERIKKFGHIIGIDDFRSHSIRKTRINQIHEITGDLSFAAEFANHKSVETTRQSYIRPKTKAELREQLKKFMQQKDKKE